MKMGKISQNLLTAFCLYGIIIMYFWLNVSLYYIF